MERELNREFSQHRVRLWLLKYHNIENETFLKYVYDGYTFRGGYKPIRKPKVRKKIALEFHRQGRSKKLAQELVTKILSLENNYVE